MLRAAAGKPKSKTRVRRTESMTKASADSHQESAAETLVLQLSSSAPSSSPFESQEQQSIESSSVTPSTSINSVSSSTIPFPPPPPPAPAPVVKATPSEATLAYLVHSLQSNLRHQHIHVITHQIELLKAKMDDFRREKEKEARVEEKRREEEQRKEWLQTMNDVDPNTAASSFPDPTIPSDVIETNIPDAKKARHETDLEPIAAAAARPSLIADPVFQQQSSPNSYHSQFQQIRETIARDEVYCYPNDDDPMYPPFLQNDQDNPLQEPPNYDAIYARMSDIIQQDSDRDADMMCESTYPPPASNPAPLPRSPPPSALTLPCSMSDAEESSTSAVSPVSSNPLLATRAQVSRDILDLCLTGDSFAGLEQRFLSGKASIDQVRYELTIIHNVLIPAHERELVEDFERLALKNGESESTNSTTMVHAADSVVLRTLFSLPAYNDSFTPDLAVDDDPDGCARMRSQVFWDPATLPCSENQQQQGQLKRKKNQRLRTSDSIESIIPTVSSSLEVSASSSPEISRPSSALSPTAARSSASNSSFSPRPTRPPTICRMNYVNHSFERLFGFTQADLKSGLGDLTLRKDHYHASHRINQRWWVEKVTDAIMYEVRAKKDGTFIYCLVHWRISFLKGKLRQAVVSFMPLPDDPEHPMPPYVEGVNLDVDTLLYGYKPPSLTKVR